MSVRAPLCYQPRYENLGTRLVCYLAKYTSLQSEKLLSVKIFRGIINGDAMNNLPDRFLLDYVFSILACNLFFTLFLYALQRQNSARQTKSDAKSSVCNTM